MTERVAIAAYRLTDEEAALIWHALQAKMQNASTKKAERLDALAYQFYWAAEREDARRQNGA